MTMQTNNSRDIERDRLKRIRLAEIATDIENWCAMCERICRRDAEKCNAAKWGRQLRRRIVEMEKKQ